MVTTENVREFNYHTNTIMHSKEHTEGSVFINVKDNEVKVLHLYDKKFRVRKVILTYDNEYQRTEICDSKSDVYYVTGPVRVEIKRPKLMIKL